MKKLQYSPVKSKNDYREYRLITLENGIKALLISDIKQDGSSTIKTHSETQLASAALCVNVASFSDPQEVPGLAHFLEHMLFMGSEKFPEENDYDSFIKSHSGSDNASTGHERTIYQFDIQPAYFEGALDRFSQFFITPLLRVDAVEREIKAVDSEFKNSLPSDDTRIEQLLAHIAMKSHPFSKFPWGNKLSLEEHPKNNDIDVMSHLHRFFNEEYSNAEMALALCSPISLDALEDQARKYFSTIKCKSIVKDERFKHQFENPFAKEDFNKLYYVYPVKDIHQIEFCWVLPPQRKNYRSKPVEYLSWLIGHECKGSILAYLKELGYAMSLESSTDYFSMFTMLNVSIELTISGLEKIEEVVHTVFQYIYMLQKNGPSEIIQDEITKVGKYYFDYVDPDEPIDYVEDLVENIFLYDDEDIIRGAYYITEFQPQIISSLQDQLTCENVNIIVLSKTFKTKCNNLEPWFKTKYSKNDIPTSWLEPSKCHTENSKLHIPHPNRYIAEDFSFKVKPDHAKELPELLEENRFGKLWYKADNKFKLPKARIYFKIVSQMKNRKSFHMTCCELMDDILSYNNQQLLYEAEVALLDYISQREELCHVIIFDGFSDKLKIFLESVITSIKDFSFSEKVFEVVKAALWRRYRNKLKKSHKFVRILRLSVLQCINNNPIENLAELENISVETLKNFANDYSASLYVESLHEGNLLENEAKSYNNIMQNLLISNPLNKEDFPKQRTLILPIGRSVVRHYGFNKTDPNTAIQNYYQIGAISINCMVKADIINHIMEEPLFDILRTKEQLGYTVYSQVHDTKGVVGLSIVVLTETGKFDADHVDEKIEDFLKQFHLKLKNLSQEEYTTYVTSFTDLLKQANLTLLDDANEHWNEIAKEEYIFDRKHRMVECAENMTKGEVEEFYEKYFIDSSTVRMLAAQVIGHPEKNVDDIDMSGSESSDDGESNSSDDESMDENENQSEKFKMNLLPVENSRYNYCITNIEKYRDELENFPDLKMIVEGS